MSNTKTTHCPNCGVDIDVNELLYHQLEEQAKEKYQTQLASEHARLKTQQAEIDSRSQALEKTVADQVAQSLATEKERLHAQLKAQLEKDQSERIRAMQQELADQSKKVIELNKVQTEVERLKREKQSLRSEIELDVEKKFNSQLVEESGKIQKRLAEQSEFKVAEKEQVINQLRDQLNEAQRKAEQGSMQLQGEVQELAIEQWLRSSFPLDEVEEVKEF